MAKAKTSSYQYDTIQRRGEDSRSERMSSVERFRKALMGASTHEVTLDAWHRAWGFCLTTLQAIWHSDFMGWRVDKWSTNSNWDDKLMRYTYPRV